MTNTSNKNYTVGENGRTKLTMEFKRAARAYCWGEGRGGSRGRTDRTAYVNHSTPVKCIEGNSAPEVKGLPYWKTGFRGPNGFHKILYTPSTMRIVVGKDWEF